MAAILQMTVLNVFFNEDTWIVIIKFQWTLD